MQEFSGSYSANDIIFLLAPAKISLTPLARKEELLQSGARHYSEMLGEEKPPSAAHLEIYRQAMKISARRLAVESLALAMTIADRHAPGDPIILASLARAGCPLGVLLLRALRYLGYRNARHYGISIIRDRGLDAAAWNLLSAKAPPQNIYFVDGWTGKGAISRELRRSLGDLPCMLVVLADPCGQADLSASREDWLIPFGILGAPISGLISRTLWSDKGLHKCMIWENMRAIDQSRQFADCVSALWSPDLQKEAASLHCGPPEDQKQLLRAKSQNLIDRLMQEYDVDSRNRIKPGIAEATRAVMRRVPDHVLVSSKTDADLALLLTLAKQANVRIIEKGRDIWPYKAVTIIRRVV